MYLHTYHAYVSDVLSYLVSFIQTPGWPWLNKKVPKKN